MTGAIIILLAAAAVSLVWVLSPKPKRRLPKGGGQRGPGKTPFPGSVFDGGARRLSSRHHRDDDDASGAVIADRLLRAADRYENAGDHERAERARHAAAEIDDGDLAGARRMEREILRPADDFDANDLPDAPDAGLRDAGSDDSGGSDSGGSEWGTDDSSSGGSNWSDNS